MSSLLYGDKHLTDTDEYRLVFVQHDYRGQGLAPTVKEVKRATDDGHRLLTEPEWRALGIVQSHGWVHVATYTRRIRPYAYALLFRRELDYIARQGNTERIGPPPFDVPAAQVPVIAQGSPHSPIRPVAQSPGRVNAVYHDIHLASRSQRHYKIHVPSGVEIVREGKRERIIVEGRLPAGPVAFPAEIVGPDQPTDLARALEPLAMQEIDKVTDTDLRWTGNPPFRAVEHPNGWVVGAGSSDRIRDRGSSKHLSPGIRGMGWSWATRRTWLLPKRKPTFWR